MAVGLSAPVPGELLPIPGVRVGTAPLGGRAVPRDDLTLFEMAEDAAVAAVFTRNAFVAAPVTVAREHLSLSSPRFMLVNAGNANAGTGARGIEDARACCALVAERAGCEPAAVLPFSTGVIGERLELDRFAPAIGAAFDVLGVDEWLHASRAIVTTDTVPKGASRRFEVDGRPCAVTGIAKGSGMIRPDMATMLAFIATDASIAPEVLDAALRRAVDGSFNRITVDGDTSTNDACVAIATGAAGATPIASSEGRDYDAFAAALGDVAERLARAIVRDGEGATKFVTVEVARGRDAAECLQVAYTVAQSPLVKTALFASDANVGRIAAAVGRSGLADLDFSRVRIRLNDVCIVDSGERPDSYTEEAGQSEMAKEEILIRVELGRGDASERVWTCDLSHEYVTINAEYRT